MVNSGAENDKPCFISTIKNANINIISCKLCKMRNISWCYILSAYMTSQNCKPCFIADVKTIHFFLGYTDKMPYHVRNINLSIVFYSMILIQKHLWEELYTGYEDFAVVSIKTHKKRCHGARLMFHRTLNDKCNGCAQILEALYSTPRTIIPYKGVCGVNICSWYM